VIRYLPPAHAPLTVRALAGGLFGGNPVPDLDAALRQRYGNGAVTLWDSGTSALTVALGLACAGTTPKVGLPAYGCYDLATAALGVGAEVLLYDLDPETLAPESASFARMLEASPDAVVVAYLFGVPFNTPALVRECAAAGCLLVEDAAQGFGATVRGRPCGSAGPVSVLSFGRGKGVTGGGGGALLINDDTRPSPEAPTSGTGWSGWSKALVQWALARPSLYRLPASLPFLRLGETIYHDPRQPSGMPARYQRVLLHVLAVAEREATIRQRNASRLDDFCERSPVVQPVRISCGTPGYLRYPVLGTDARLRSDRARQMGIMPGYPMVLAQLPALAGRVLNRADRFPGAERLVQELVTLPTHSLLIEKDFDQLATVLSVAPKISS